MVNAQMKKLLLVDAYAMIFRAYYAFIRAPRMNSKGENTSAIFGFCVTLEDLLKKINPTHVGVAFDPKGGTFRHEAYEQYKAQRPETPEDIRKAVPVIKQILEAMNIPVLEVPGFEADDVIGTLSQQGEKAGFEVYMATPDKDYGQLVSDHVFMYRPRHTGGFELTDSWAMPAIISRAAKVWGRRQLWLSCSSSETSTTCLLTRTRSKVRSVRKWRPRQRRSVSRGSWRLFVPMCRLPWTKTNWRRRSPTSKPSQNSIRNSSSTPFSRNSRPRPSIRPFWRINNPPRKPNPLTRISSISSPLWRNQMTKW